MPIPRPSKYQVFLTTMVIIIIVILLLPTLIPKEEDETKLRIGIVDSGCSFDQRSKVREYQTFTSAEFGYDYTENSIYDTINHGKKVCEVIIDGTDDVYIYSAKIANSEGQITFEGLFAAIEYLVIQKDVDIINLSLGSEPYISDQLLSAFEEYASSKVFIAAVGNKANDINYPAGIVDWPANLPWVIGVGAGNNLSRDDYSSFGRSNTGLYATDFVEDGRIDSSRGTSFATPRVTVAYANLWQQFLDEKKSVTPELLNFHLANSDGEDTFNEELGWGTPDLSTDDTTGVLIEGIEEKDPLQRFESEVWTKSWKIFSTYKTPKLIVSGNATSQIIDQQLHDYDWGKIFTISFNGSAISATYSLDISHNDGNSVSYRYNISQSPPDKKILMDHRNTINGLAHEYGQYFRFDQYMRENNIQVDQIQSGSVDMSQYDMIIVTEFGKSDSDRIFYRDHNSTLMHSYANYVQKGGQLQIMTTYPSSFYGEEYISSLQRFGASITKQRIPQSGEIAYITNLTNFNIFNDVEAIGIGGMAINPSNSSQSNLGSFKLPPQTEFGRTQFFNIGINTTLGDGTIYIWSSSLMLQNEYLLTTGGHYIKFLSNYFSLIG